MHFTHINRRIAALGLAGVLAVGVAGVSFAQVPSGSPPPAPGTQSTPHAGRGGHLRQVGLNELVKASGLSADVFKQGYQAGKSIDQILAANGKNSASVQATVLADLKTRLDQAVAGGKLKQAQEDKVYSAAQQGLPQLFARVPTPGQHSAKRGDRLHAGGGLVAEAAKDIGIDPKELAKDLRSGQTVAQVAAAHQVDVNGVIADLTNTANARIDALVASGKLDPTKAAQLKGKTAQRVATFVNQGRQHHK